MRTTPEWLLLVTPFAVAGGIALQRGISRGSTPAWCVFTACAVVCLGVVGLAALYGWYCRRTERDSRVPAYSQGWPSELDVLLSNAGPEERALAAAQLAVRASLRKWPYRDDAVRVLEGFVHPRAFPDIVTASALGSLSMIRPSICPAGVVEIARVTNNPRLLSASIALLAMYAETRPELMKIVDTAGKGNAALQRFSVSALDRALKQAPSREEKEEIVTLLEQLASREWVDKSVRKQAKGQISQAEEVLW